MYGNMVLTIRRFKLVVKATHSVKFSDVEIMGRRGWDGG